MGRGRPAPERITARTEPVWSPTTDVKQWRAVWVYWRKRSVRDHHTVCLQQERAQGIIDGNKHAKSARFAQNKGGYSAFDQASFDRGYGMAGWKGYSANLPLNL